LVFDVEHMTFNVELPAASSLVPGDKQAERILLEQGKVDEALEMWDELSRSARDNTSCA